MPGWSKKNFAEIVDRSPNDTMAWRLSRRDIESRELGVSR